MEQTFHSFQTTTTNEEAIPYLVDYSVESIIDAFIETRTNLLEVSRQLAKMLYLQ